MSLKPLLISLAFLSSSAWSSTYWISKAGDDKNDCKTENVAECATIQKALSLVAPGDTIYIKPGTYSEDSSKSTYTKPCYFFNGLASICINTSGTKSSPITVSAAPSAARGSVILDNLNARVGIIMNAKSYYAFRGLTIKNSVKNGIANQSQAGNDVADPQYLSVGVTVEDCEFYGVTTPDAGDNIAAIGMWSSQDWVVRNNYIDGVASGSGIRAYGVINALVEHNTIKNVSEGIMWKDHFVKNLTTRGVYFESEIRYNMITAKSFGVLIQIRGANTPEAGHNYIHHNIFNGFSNLEPAGVRVRMYEAYGQSGNVTVTNNLFDCAGFAGCKGVSIDASDKIEISKNIFLKNDIPIDLIKQDAVKIPNLVVADNNIFIDKFMAIVDRYSTTSKTFTTLASWQAALSGSSTVLALSNPDKNSKLVTYSTSLFLTDLVRPYIGAFMALNSQTTAGPYELGTEIIGEVGVSPPLSPSSTILIK